MHYIQNNDSIYVNECLQLIIDKLDWGESENWTNQQVELLSQELHKASGISISSRTIRRLFGKDKTYKHVYNPQLATKNALANYLGYAGWEAFKEKHSPGYRVPDSVAITQPDSAVTILPKDEQEPMPEPVLQQARRQRKAPQRMLLFTVGIALGLILLGWGFTHFAKPDPTTFTGKDLVGSYPHAAVFHYRLPAGKTGIYMVETDRQEYVLTHNEGYITHGFSIPNYYAVHLSHNRNTISTLNVHVQSKGWANVVSYNKNTAIYEMLPPPKGEKTGYLHVKPEEVKAAGVNTSHEYWVAHHNIRNFDASGDNFTLEARMKNDPKEGGVSCFDTNLEAETEHGTMRIMLVKPECAQYVAVQAGEVSLNGSFHPLNNLAQDVSDWRTIRIEVRNKKASFFFEDKLIYQTAFERTQGRIKGIICRFKGCGSVDYVRLWNEKGRLVYRDEF